MCRRTSRLMVHLELWTQQKRSPLRKFPLQLMVLCRYSRNYLAVLVFLVWWKGQGPVFCSLNDILSMKLEFFESCTSIYGRREQRWMDSDPFWGDHATYKQITVILSDNISRSWNFVQRFFGFVDRVFLSRQPQDRFLKYTTKQCQGS